MTQTQRNARYAARVSATKQARMLGWQETDVIAVFRTKDGTTVAIDDTGARVPLTLDPDFDDVGIPATTVGSLSHAPAVKRSPDGKLYAPDSWDPALWNSNRARIIEAGWTKDAVRANLTEAAQAKRGEKGMAKRIRQAFAVIDACPDTPDWYTALPVAIENDSQLGDEA